MLIVAVITSLETSLATGMDSPVIMDSSRVLAPRHIFPMDEELVSSVV
jgi:hypothetical protein